LVSNSSLRDKISEQRDPVHPVYPCQFSVWIAQDAFSRDEYDAQDEEPVPRDSAKRFLTSIVFEDAVASLTKSRFMGKLRILRLFSLALIIVFSTGCASQGATSMAQPPPSAKPKTSPHYSIWLKLNPAWWIATSKPPADYQPHYALRKIDWFFRNPLHNFTFYVIGISDHFNDKDFHRYGMYPHDDFSPRPGLNICMIHFHWLRLPFIAYWNPHMSFYFGWRRAGEFGMKLNFFRHPVSSLQ
jgi:hypothetical protein